MFVCLFLQLWSEHTVKCVCVRKFRCFGVGNRVPCVCAPIARFSCIRTQWFPLNMLIEIAYKFTEHLCSSAMSNFSVDDALVVRFSFFAVLSQCFQVALYTFLAKRIFITIRIAFVFVLRAILLLCVRERESARKVFTVDASALMYAFVVLSRKNL